MAKPVSPKSIKPMANPSEHPSPAPDRKLDDIREEERQLREELERLTREAREDREILKHEEAAAAPEPESATDVAAEPPAPEPPPVAPPPPPAPEPPPAEPPTPEAPPPPESPPTAPPAGEGEPRPEGPGETLRGDTDRVASETEIPRTFGERFVNRLRSIFSTSDEKNRVVEMTKALVSQQGRKIILKSFLRVAGLGLVTTTLDYFSELGDTVKEREIMKDMVEKLKKEIKRKAEGTPAEATLTFDKELRNKSRELNAKIDTLQYVPEGWKKAFKHNLLRNVTMYQKDRDWENERYHHDLQKTLEEYLRVKTGAAQFGQDLVGAVGVFSGLLVWRGIGSAALALAARGYRGWKQYEKNNIRQKDRVDQVYQAYNASGGHTTSNRQRLEEIQRSSGFYTDASIEGLTQRATVILNDLLNEAPREWCKGIALQGTKLEFLQALGVAGRAIGITFGMINPNQPVWPSGAIEFVADRYKESGGLISMMQDNWWMNLNNIANAPGRIKKFVWSFFGAEEPHPITQVEATPPTPPPPPPEVAPSPEPAFDPRDLPGVKLEILPISGEPFENRYYEECAIEGARYEFGTTVEGNKTLIEVRRINGDTLREPVVIRSKDAFDSLHKSYRKIPLSSPSAPAAPPPPTPPREAPSALESTRGAPAELISTRGSPPAEPSRQPMIRERSGPGFIPEDAEASRAVPAQAPARVSRDEATAAHRDGRLPPGERSMSASEEDPVPQRSDTETPEIQATSHGRVAQSFITKFKSGFFVDEGEDLKDPETLRRLENVKANFKILLEGGSIKPRGGIERITQQEFSNAVSYSQSSDGKWILAIADEEQWEELQGKLWDRSGPAVLPSAEDPTPPHEAAPTDTDTTQKQPEASPPEQAAPSADPPKDLPVTKGAASPTAPDDVPTKPSFEGLRDIDFAQKEQALSIFKDSNLHESRKVIEITKLLARQQSGTKFILETPKGNLEIEKPGTHAIFVRIPHDPSGRTHRLLTSDTIELIEKLWKK